MPNNAPSLQWLKLELSDGTDRHTVLSALVLINDALKHVHLPGIAGLYTCTEQKSMGNGSKFLPSHSSTFKELWALTFAIKYYADKGQIRQLLRSDGFSVDALAHMR